MRRVKSCKTFPWEELNYTEVKKLLLYNEFSNKKN